MALSFISFKSIVFAIFRIQITPVSMGVCLATPLKVFVFANNNNVLWAFGTTLCIFLRYANSFHCSLLKFSDLVLLYTCI